MRPVLRLYNEEQLRLRESPIGTLTLKQASPRQVQEVGVRWPPAWNLVSWSNELVVRQLPANKDVNTEAEDATALGAVTRRQLVKTQQTEKS
jgi:hypothetical protein